MILKARWYEVWLDDTRRSLIKPGSWVLEQARPLNPCRKWSGLSYRLEIYILIQMWKKTKELKAFAAAPKKFFFYVSCSKFRRTSCWCLVSRQFLVCEGTSNGNRRRSCWNQISNHHSSCRCLRKDYEEFACVVFVITSVTKVYCFKKFVRKTL